MLVHILLTEHSKDVQAVLSEDNKSVSPSLCYFPLLLLPPKKLGQLS
jgi:hypothetical protein